MQPSNNLAHNKNSLEQRNPLAIVGDSTLVQQALTQAKRVAKFDCPVLITGETGTGKEMFARAIHRASPRAIGPFVPVNCPAIPAELAESELFGHVKGAFTGAIHDRTGAFCEANEGTLFLDEVGEMAPAIQAKLLRVLQEFEVRPVGGQPQRINIRLICATNCDLTTENTFRDDLYHRLVVAHIQLPSLRERPDDILQLVDYFLRIESERMQVLRPKINKHAERSLYNYDWPGNVRELHNKIIYLLTLGADEITPAMLPTSIVERPRAVVSWSLPERGCDMKTEIDRLERTLCKQAMERTNGHVTNAARLLGLKRTTLSEKMRTWYGTN